MGEGPIMRILVTGSSGLVGSALVPLLAQGGHRVRRLLRARRPAPDPDGRYWDPDRGVVHTPDLEGLDAVVHLAGESIASGRWTAAKKARIRESRVGSTALLSGALAALAGPPRVLVCASAVGYYGDRGEAVLREESRAGTGFLTEVCRAWEAAAEPAARRGIRVVHARFGMVLSPAGGALARMLPLFRLGLGGRLGSGRQWVSWIALEDAAAAVAHALATESLAGPVNVVTPNPVTNTGLTRNLGRALGRPTPFPVPAFAIRLAFGQMADELLLASARVLPARLVASGYAFRHPGLDGALRALLGQAR